ncbi:MAG TPA: GNAT family N-acetyltransferase [Acidobacteriaceae bacterium]|nr:GNAT family N-acetyltransferase [Acidobacteriaceae bacterium]
MPDFQHELLHHEEQLRALEPEWKALWAEDPCATPFQSPEWLLPWWRQFGGELRTVAIRQGGRLIGLLPFYIYRDWRSGMRQCLLIGVGTTDYLDGVFAPECSVEAVRRALRLLCSEPEWDAITASQLRPESKLYQALQASTIGADGDAMAFESESCGRVPAVPIAQLPAKIRQNVRYYSRRASTQGELRMTLADEGNYLDCFDALQRMHAERWQARGERGVFADRRMVAWHQEAMPLLLEAGMLRMQCLRLDREPIGALYAVADPAGLPNGSRIRAERKEYFYLMAHSTRHAALSPGTLVCGMAIEQAANEGVQTIDFLRGEERYKEFWHVQHVPTYGVSLSRAAAPCGAAEAA